MKPTDRYGLELSTTREAAELYNEALDRILCLRNGASALLQDAVRADPRFALAHATLALIGQDCAATVDATGAALAAAHEAAEHRSTPRERSFVNAVGVLVSSEPEAGAAAVLRHIEDYPRDALMVSAAVPTISFTGVTAGEEAWSVIENLSGVYGADWWYQGQLAFVRQEQLRYVEAEALSAAALTTEPRAGHAVHARAHVFYETGEHQEGLAWLDEWITERGPSAQYLAHFSWHAALHEMMLGQDAAARCRYQTQLAPPHVTGSRALIDSASMLWRLRMTGSWHGPQPVAEVLDVVPASWLTAPETAFAALHSALALAAAEDLDGLRKLSRYAAEHGKLEFPEIIAPLCNALAAVVQERWQVAIPLLEKIVPERPRLGGSAAQQEAIEETLLHALIASGRHGQAAVVLSARLDRRPARLDRRRLQAAQAAHCPARQRTVLGAPPVAAARAGGNVRVRTRRSVVVGGREADMAEMIGELEERYVD
jgi:tetratricopeptide (TPR) repeat protein